jgi:hypothetical protein
MRRILLIILLILLVGLAGLYFWEKKRIATTGVQPTGVFKSFFPLNQSPVTVPNSTVPDTTDTTARAQTLSRFTQLSARAIAGYSAYTDTYKITIPAENPKSKPTTQTVTDNVVRYIARVSGFVYEKRNSDTPVQISNVYIPNVYEGSFMDTNQSAVLRFLRDDNQTIGTYIVPIPPKNSDGTRTQKEGRFLNDGISSFAVSPDGSEGVRIYMTNGTAEIMTSDSGDKNRKEVINSPFTEWLPLWPTKQTLYLQTKAASSAAGYLYRVDRTERKLHRILGDISGLTATVSPSGTYVLYSQSIQNSFQSILLNTKTGSSTTLNLKVLPEKCLWDTSRGGEDLLCAGNNAVPSGNYPESWYMGLVHFSDNIFRIYTSNTTFEVVYDGSDGNYDMTNLQYNANNNTVYFIDKNTGSLWQYAL